MLNVEYQLYLKDSVKNVHSVKIKIDQVFYFRYNSNWQQIYELGEISSFIDRFAKLFGAESNKNRIKIR